MSDDDMPRVLHIQTQPQAGDLNVFYGFAIVYGERNTVRYRRDTDADRAKDRESADALESAVNAFIAYNGAGHGIGRMLIMQAEHAVRRLRGEG